MNNKIINAIAVCLASVTFGLNAQAYESSWDGNHPEADSEAWTWMGHLQEVKGTGASLRLGPNGLGFIYTYTRNKESNLVSLNYRLAGLTPTVNGVGQKYITDTVYLGEHPGSSLRTKKGALDIQFQAGDWTDIVQTQPMTAADQKQLDAVLPLYPGLKVAPGFAVKKQRFYSNAISGNRFNLNMYSIWPAVSSADGTLTFYGQTGTMEFSEPMLVTVGTYNGKKVVGLSFSDHQWAKDYFGVHIMNGLSDLLKYGHALGYAHNWSGFHVHNKRTNDWAFFNIWHQYHRVDLVRDALVDDSRAIYSINGIETGDLSPDEYTWKTSGFVEQKGTEVLMAYASGRYGFFPSRSNFDSGRIGFNAEMLASPTLQSLDQPIYFFEGYASGEGTWHGDPISLSGRMEASRMMFRVQDYQEMLEVLTAQTLTQWQQKPLQKWLKDRIAEDAAAGPDTLVDYWVKKFAVLGSMLGDMDLKLSIFKNILSGNATTIDSKDANVSIYH